jgi:hypothetical protein
MSAYTRQVRRTFVFSLHGAGILIRSVGCLLSCSPPYHSSTYSCTLAFLYFDLATESGRLS